MLTNLYLRSRNWLEDQEGQTLAEYALILALIAILAIAALTVLGGGINAILNRIGNKLQETTS
ncbi:MAG: Flp family type IVb pilin [Chloroflexota bacterium]|nr:Flp family type IVb pilin [Chloroflexota bacterium]